MRGQRQGALGGLERHRRLHAGGTGKGNFGRSRLDLDDALVARRGERLALLAGPQRRLGGDFCVILRHLGLGDPFVEAGDQGVELGFFRRLLLRRLARRGKLDLALGKLRLLLLKQLVDTATLGGEPVGLALLGIALLSDAGLQLDQAVELL